MRIYSTFAAKLEDSLSDDVDAVFWQRRGAEAAAEEGFGEVLRGLLSAHAS
jgi:hypothetical protein